MKLPNGVYSALKDFGKEAIARIHKYITNDQFKTDAENIEKREYGIDFAFYGVRFRIKIELKTNCEATKEGYLAVYRLEGSNEGEVEKPFEIWPPETQGIPRHTMRIKYRGMSECQVECPDTDSDYGYISFFGMHFPKKVADAAIDIDLDR